MTSTKTPKLCSSLSDIESEANAILSEYNAQRGVPQSLFDGKFAKSDHVDRI